MNTITPHLVAATTYAAQHLSLYHAAGAMTAAAVSGIGALVVMVVVVVVAAAVAAAARSLAALLSELLRAATAVTSVLLTAGVAIFLGFAFLVH